MRARHSSYRPTLVRRLIGWFTTLLIFGVAQAHDIPAKITVHMYVKAENNRVVVLTRAPLEAFAEVQIPVRGPGFLDMSRATASLNDAAHMYIANGLHVYADGVSLGEAQFAALRVAPASDTSFTAFDSALHDIQHSPLAADVDVFWKQALLDVMFTFPLPDGIDAQQARFAIDANLGRLSMDTHTVLRYVPLSGAERAFDFSGSPGRFELEPGWWHAFSHFVSLGFGHILDGVDHLLFLFCLVIPARSVRALIPAITAFTLAHSITLISSALGLVPTAAWFGPLIETLIALSVFYMACENILSTRGISLSRRWLIVYAFGLIHGFGFSFILADRMQFAGEHLISSLLAFNVGVELGQLVVLLVAVPILRALYRTMERRPHGVLIATLLLSALAAHSAWHWLTERGEQLMQFAWGWPIFDAAFFASLTRWLMLLVSAAAVAWLIGELLARIATGKTPSEGR